MDILDIITKLREARHWSEYQLAEKSGLTQSTISSWYRKNMLPTFPSLEKTCEAFNISLSQFFLEDSDKTVLLNDKQIKVLEATSKLDDEQLNALLDFLETL